ncbi:MAG: plasmid mobilization relaxosome protein MobC [Salinivirgaceae bacterium]|nr:plasmid mobilization relaxosome protein MobC [Salinivirgaceae bacterium]
MNNTNNTNLNPKKNPKGGRPSLKNGRKCHLIQFNVDDEQLHYLKEKLRNSRYHGMSQLIREMLFRRHITITVETANARELQFELAKIGANINQIAHRCNIDAIGGTTSRLHLSDKYVISRACNIIEKALKNKTL